VTEVLPSISQLTRQLEVSQPKHHLLSLVCQILKLAYFEVFLSLLGNYLFYIHVKAHLVYVNNPVVAICVVYTVHLFIFHNMPQCLQENASAESLKRCLHLVIFVVY